jgi:hypothetical protein
VRAVRLSDGAGETPRAFGPESRVVVDVDWALREPAPTRFTVDVMAADGRLVFSATHDAGPLAGEGTVSLELARLGLGGGVYEVLVAASGSGEATPNPTRVALHVEASAEVKGLLRPQLAWALKKGAGPGA